MTQGGLVLPTLFDVSVDIVVRDWMSLTVEDNFATHKGLGMAALRCMGVFYANDIIIS